MKFTTNDAVNRQFARPQEMGTKTPKNALILIGTNSYMGKQDVEKSLFCTCRKAPNYAIKLSC